MGSPANESSMDEFSDQLQSFSYPGEVERLAVTAREFNDPDANEDSSDEFVLSWALSALAWGVANVLGKSHPLFEKARAAADSASEVMETWRQVDALPQLVVDQMIEGVRDQRNRWAAEDGGGFDLR